MKIDPAGLVFLVNRQNDAYHFKHACKRNCEGIVSKRPGSLYRSGRRSARWVKVKNAKAAAVTREAHADRGRDRRKEDMADRW